MSHAIDNKKALRAFLSEPSTSDDLTRDNFLKYFPKYVHQLDIESITGPLISKAKRVKILHILQTYSHSVFPRKTLLYNKEKCIQAFAPIFELEYSREFFEEVRAFTNLKSLQLSTLFEREDFPYFKKICQYAGFLSKLETLELEITPECCFDDILEINSCEKMLKSLTALKIDCSWRCDIEERIIVLKGLLKNKNILKYTTHLKLGSFNHPTLFEFFENLLACCPKLVSINFQADKEIQEEDEDFCDWEESVAPTQGFVPRYLQALGNLNDLQDVTIHCGDILAFIRDFTLPPSVQTVWLSFENLDFFNYSIDKDLPQGLMTFCDKWSHLTNLKTLTVYFNQFTDPDGFTFRFLQYWLKRVKNLEYLSLTLSTAMHTKKHWNVPEDQADFDLSIFLESIQHLRNTLQFLEIIDYQLIYCLKNLPQQPFGFPCLLEFSLEGSMSPQEFDLQTLFQTNLRDLMIAGSNEEPLSVVLEGLAFESLDSFLKFIQSFDRERSDDKRELIVSFSAFLKNEDPNVFYEDTQHFTLKSKGFSLEGTLATDTNEEHDVDLESLLKNHLNVLEFEEPSF